MNRGQGAIMDALFFILICGGAATLMFYTSGLYGESTSTQISSVYNYEYNGNALVALHYARDGQGNWFWNELKDKLDESERKKKVTNYLDDTYPKIWSKLRNSAPGRYPFLCFKPDGKSEVEFCYPNAEEYCDNAYLNRTEDGTSTGIKLEEEDFREGEGTSYSSLPVSINMDYEVILRQYY